MSEKMIAKYNNLYEKFDNFFGSEPLEQVENLKEYLPQGEVLDVGGGDGRNALYLSEQGFSVTVADFAEEALKKVQDRAEKEGFTIKTKTIDFSVEGIENEYNSIIFSFVLHYFDSSRAVVLLEQAKEKTTPGGIHMVATFMNEGDFYEERPTKVERYYPSVKDLLTIYSDWEVLENEVTEIETKKEDENGKPLMGLVVNLIVKKPDESSE